MHKLTMFTILLMLSMLLGACSSSNGPTKDGTDGTRPLEFTSLGGTYRVQAPSGWKISEPMMGFTSLTTNENDVNIVIGAFNPEANTLKVYPDAESQTATSGQTFQMYRQPKNMTTTSTVDGTTFKSSDAVYVLVPLQGDSSALVMIAPATTRKLDEGLMKQILDMMTTLEVVKAA
jgi:hypothetical protein